MGLPQGSRFPAADFDIPDKRTRKAKPPYRIRNDRVFRPQLDLIRGETEEAFRRDKGFPDPDEIVGGYHRI